MSNEDSRELARSMGAAIGGLVYLGVVVLAIYYLASINSTLERIEHGPSCGLDSAGVLYDAQ